MKNNHSTFLLLTGLIILSLFGSFRSKWKSDQRNSIAFSDTSGFIVNSTGGWESFSSYFTPIGTDSMELEFLISHGNPIDWKSKQFIGVISGSAYMPKNDQEITYPLLPDNTWAVEIKPNGNCFLKQLMGNTPTGNPVVLPIKIRYRIK